MQTRKSSSGHNPHQTNLRRLSVTQCRRAELLPCHTELYRKRHPGGSPSGSVRDAWTRALHQRLPPGDHTLSYKPSRPWHSIVGSGERCNQPTTTLACRWSHMTSWNLWHIFRTARCFLVAISGGNGYKRFSFVLHPCFMIYKFAVCLFKPSSSSEFFGKGRYKTKEREDNSDFYSLACFKKGQLQPLFS